MNWQEIANAMDWVDWAFIVLLIAIFAIAILMRKQMKWKEVKQQ